MRLLGLVFDNIGLKILALGMAWAVWFMVSQGLNDEKSVPLHVRVVVGDPNAVRVTPIEPDEPLDDLTVTVRMSGPARWVGDFQRMSARAEATLTLGSESYPGKEELEKQAVFTLDDLEIPDLDEFPGLRAVSMTPELIRVNVERMEVREIPVEKPELEDPPGTVDVRIVTWDTLVKIRASAKYLQKRLVTIHTSVDAEVLRQLAANLLEEPEITQDVPLTIAPYQRPLFELVDRDRLTVRLELRRLESATFTVPVRVYESADSGEDTRGGLRFSPSNALDERLVGIYEQGTDGGPPTLQLVLEGSPAAMAAVKAEMLRVFVLADEMAAEDVLANLPVYVAGLPVGARMKQQITLAVERVR